MKHRSIWEIVFKAAVITGLIIVIGMQFDTTDKIVYVDSVKLINGYTGMQYARKEFELKVPAWKSNLDTLQTELDVKIKEYEKNKARLSAKEKQLTEALIQTKYEQFQNYHAAGIHGMECRPFIADAREWLQFYH